MSDQELGAFVINAIGMFVSWYVLLLIIGLFIWIIKKFMRKNFDFRRYNRYSFMISIGITVFWILMQPLLSVIGP